MVKDPGHDKFTPYKSGIAILLSLALIVQVFLFDIPQAKADAVYGDILDLVLDYFSDYDVVSNNFFSDHISELYDQGYTSLCLYELSNANYSKYVLMMFQSDVKYVRAIGAYYGIGASTGSSPFLMDDCYVIGWNSYYGRYFLSHFDFPSTASAVYEYGGLTYPFFSASATSYYYVGGTNEVWDSEYNVGILNGLDSGTCIYSNIYYQGTSGVSNPYVAPNVVFEPNVLSPVDNSLISLSTASRDYPIGAIGNSVSLPVLRITPSEVSDDVYSTWDITIHAVSDKGSFDFTKTVNHPGFNDAVYFFDSSQSAYLIPIYIDVPYSQFMGSYSADDLSYLYVDQVSLIGHGADNTYKAFYLKPFAIFGTIPSTVSDDIYDDRHDDYVSPYSTVVELEKDNYLIQFTNGGIDMTEWDSIKSQYDDDIFSYALTDMDLSQIPDWADIFCYQATVGTSISSSAILDNIEAVFSHQIGSINLMVVSAKNKQEALSEITSTGLQDISDVLLIVYGNSQMSLYNWEGYFTHRFYTRKLDYDVIDAINGISPQLGGILTASENEYRLFDSYYSYLHSYLDNFDDNLFNKIDGTNSRLNTVVSGLSSISSTVNNIDESLLTSVTHLSSIDTALGGTLSVSDSGSHNLLSAINTGIANLEISFSDGVDAIVDAIEAIDISVGDITIPGMPDYSGKLDQILNAIQYHKAVGQLPYHDYYSDNASDFISGMNTFFGSLGFFNTNDTFDVGGTSTAIFDSFKNTMGLYESDDYDQLEGNDGTLDITTHGVNPFTNYFSSDWDADVVTPLGGSDE